MNNYNDIENVYNDYQNSFKDFEVSISEAKIKAKEIEDHYFNTYSNFEIGRKNTFDSHSVSLQSDLSDLETKRSKLLGEINRYNLIFEEGSTKFGKITPEISNRINELRNAVNELIDEQKIKLQSGFNEKIKKLEINFKQSENHINNDFSIKKNELIDTVRVLFENACEKENNFFNSFPSTCELSTLINDISVFANQNFSTNIQIGHFEYSTTLFNDVSFSKNFKIILPFIDKKSLLIIHDSITEKEAENIHDNVITRSLLSFGLGNLKLTFCDLKEMGSIFNEFIPISHEIVSVGFGKNSSEEAIKKVENNNQKIALSYTISSKHSSFNTLGKYNLDKILSNNFDSIIPHNICVLTNLSYEADENLIKNLKRLIKNGNQNGTQFILLWNKEDENDRNKTLLNELIVNNEISVIDFFSTNSNYFLKEFKLVTENLPENKKHELVNSYNEEFEAISKNVAKVYFKDTIPSKDKWFKYKSHELISVGVGVSKNHRGEQNIEIKTDDFQAHTLMSGGNGSGKTNFMKTFITSMAIKYSPDEVELYLIDLKNGVGFNVFNKHKLPHVKMYAFGAENELILNILDTLNDEMNNRLDLFRQKEVEDIKNFKIKNPNEKLPRIVLIIDEFATIFEDENPFQNEISARLFSLARKARAAGINMFLSTQNFNSTGHLFSKSKSEMPIRIVLKSSPEASAALLESRNDGIKQVTTVGDGLLNYRQGNLLNPNDNQFFKAYLLENDHLETILMDIKTESVKSGFISNKQLLYNNFTEADFSKNIQILKQIKLETTEDENGNKLIIPVQLKKIPIWLGEPTIISENHFKIDLEKNFYENILISGLEKSITIHSVFNIARSLLFAFASGEIAIRFISFLSDEENTDLKLSYLKNIEYEFDFSFHTADNYEFCFNELNAELNFRKEKINLKTKRIFVFIIGVEKAKNLYADGYTLSGEGKIFTDLLEGGPGVNMHVVCEVRQPSQLVKILKSNAVDYFKHRIVYHLGNEDESAEVLKSKIASSIYKQEEPHTRNRAIYYNAEFEKKYYKIKPYSINNINELYPNNFGSSKCIENIFLSKLSKPDNIVSKNSQIINLDDPKTESDQLLNTYEKEINNLDALIANAKEVNDDDDDDITAMFNF